MDQQFKRILELVRKTKDTLIVTDPNGADVSVIMDFNRYEQLLKIASPVKEAQKEKDIWDVLPKADEKNAQTWDPAKLDEEGLADLERQYASFVKDSMQEHEASLSEKTPEVKKLQENSIDEDRFYLEPIE